MKRNTVDVITLGCSKNLVDSEKLLRQLQANGYRVTHDSEHPEGEIAVINTCGFIGDAKEESINTILEFCEAKEEGRLRRLYVMGCLSERYLKELQVEIPQVDKFYGKFDWEALLADLGKPYHAEIGRERSLAHLDGKLRSVPVVSPLYISRVVRHGNKRETAWHVARRV